MNLKKFTNEKLSTLALFLVDVILRRQNLSNGLIATSKNEIEKAGDFVHEPGRFGFVEKEVLRKDGLFMPYRPVGQQQNIGDEKMHCVSESYCNTIETRINYFLELQKKGIIEKKQLDIVNIFRYFGLIKTINGREVCLVSTRYVAAGSGTTIRGNNQKSVADFVRHYGLIPYDMFPYVEDWNEYYYTGDTKINGNRLFKEHIERGKKLVEYIDFNYEWVSPQNIISTYPYGPLQTIVFAWESPKNGVYQRTSRASNHATQGDGFKTYHQLFDSYDPFGKQLVANFYKDSAMLCTARTKKDLTPFNNDYLKELKKRGFEFVLLVNKFKDYLPGIYQLFDDHIAKADLKIVLDTGVKELAQEGKLTGISTEDFKKILNII